MFLRFFALILLLSSNVNWGSTDFNPYETLEEWRNRDALPGEYVDIDNCLRSPLNDYWREENLLQDVPRRAALYKEIKRSLQGNAIRNQRKLQSLRDTTLQHHKLLYENSKRSLSLFEKFDCKFGPTYRKLIVILEECFPEVVDRE